MPWWKPREDKAAKEYEAALDRFVNPPLPKYADTADLIRQTHALHREAAFPNPDEFAQIVVDLVSEETQANAAKLLATAPMHAFVEAVTALCKTEGLHFPPKLIPIPVPDRIEVAKYTDYLLSLQARYRDPARTRDVAVCILASIFVEYASRLPGIAFNTPTGSMTVRVIEHMTGVSEIVQHIVATLLNDSGVKELNIFPELRKTIFDNLLAASAKPNTLVYPAQSKLSPHELVNTYLKGTPFPALFEVSIPFSVPDSAREEHTMIVAGSGAGKTTLIQQIILDDLAKPDPPPMVIIDPKGEFVKRVAHLDVFHPDTGRLRDRLIYLDPNASPPPALNMFAPSDRAYSDYDRQDVESELIEDFGYVFSTIGNPLTAKQQVPFNFCVRLLFKTPGATISTFMELLSDDAKFPKDPIRSAEHSPFAPVIARLDPLSNQFFTREFYASNFNETKDQLRARLYSILGQPRLAAMFSSRNRQLDLYHSMQNKKIVLVNAAVGTPGSEASQLLSRYILTLSVNAAFEQAKTLPKEKWKTAYLICDEFHLFADEFKTPRMLQLCREYKLGILMAFQQMHGKPFTDDLRTSLSSSTSVKYASSPEGSDIGYVARDLRTDEAFVRAQTKTRTTGRFACFVRGLLDQPVAITVPFGNIQAQPQMDDEAFAKLLHINRHRLSAPALPAPPERPKPIVALAAPSASRQHDEPEAPSLPPKSDTGAVDPDAGEHTDPAAKWGLKKIGCPRRPMALHSIPYRNTLTVMPER